MKNTLLSSRKAKISSTFQGGKKKKKKTTKTTASAKAEFSDEALTPN